MAIKIIWGHLGQGKTYYAVRKVMKAFGKKKYKYIFTNFPVFHPKYGWTHKWNSSYAKKHLSSGQVIVDALIVVDEAYEEFNSRNSVNRSKKDSDDIFTESEHKFFATSRHLGNDLFLIAHNPVRIEKVIREITSEFLLMHCHAIPILGIPIWFSCDVFMDIEAVEQRYRSKHAIYCVERFLFSRKVANAYDTHYYRPADIPECHFESWGEVLDMERPDIPPGLLTRFRSWIKRVIFRRPADSAEDTQEDISREIIPVQPEGVDIEEDLLE